MVAEGALQQQTSNKVKRQHRSVTVCFLPTRLSSGQLTGCPDWIGVVGLCLTVSLTAGYGPPGTRCTLDGHNLGTKHQVQFLVFGCTTKSLI